MKKSVNIQSLVLLLGTFVNTSVYAVSPEDFLKDKPKPSKKAKRSSTGNGGGLPIDFTIGAGYSIGGQNINETDILGGNVDPDQEIVAIGDAFGFWGGLEYMFAPEFSVGANLGYQFNAKATETLGDIDYARVPIEGLFYYRPMDQLRLGVGGSVMTAHTLNTNTQDDGGLETTFDTAFGGILEASYIQDFTSDIYATLTLRYQLIGYTIDGLSIQDADNQNKLLNGSHYGFNLSVYY